MILSAQCQVCKGNAISLDLKVKGFDIWRCADCGLRIVNPQPSPRELQTWYASFFASGIEGQAYAQQEEQHLEFARRSSRFLARRLEHGRLLDIGCAHGHFMHEMQLAGWDSIGIELDEGAADVARKRFGVEVSVGEAEQLLKTMGGFDLVTMWANIEHLRDPVSVITQSFSVLRKGGKIVISTGRLGGVLESVIRGYSMWYDPPQHLWYFTQKAMRILLEAAGFTEIEFHVSLCGHLYDSIWEVCRILKHSTLLVPHVLTYSSDKRNLKAAVGTEMIVLGSKPAGRQDGSR